MSSLFALSAFGQFSRQSFSLLCDFMSLYFSDRTCWRPTRKAREMNDSLVTSDSNCRAFTLQGPIEKERSCNEKHGQSVSRVLAWVHGRERNRDAGRNSREGRCKRMCTASESLCAVENAAVVLVCKASDVKLCETVDRETSQSINMARTLKMLCNSAIHERTIIAIEEGKERTTNRQKK